MSISVAVYPSACRVVTGGVTQAVHLVEYFMFGSRRGYIFLLFSSVDHDSESRHSSYDVLQL